MEINNLTISKIREGFLRKDFSAVEITEEYLKQIDKKDKSISAYLTITKDLAISQAKEIDKSISDNKKFSDLAGVPCSIKDNILIKEIKCTAGSKILENYIAPYDATVIKKLKEDGAVILGKTNLDEFGMGASTENSAFKITHNPDDLTRVPGGTSGGSAAAVAASECCYALGSDTGGSIRQPASFCGVVGLKPTYGAVSRYGLMAFASSLDQIGSLTKTVEDARIVFNAISGKDEMDSTSVELNPKSQIPNPKSRHRRGLSMPTKSSILDKVGTKSEQIPNSKFQIKNLRIGIPKEYFVKGIDQEVEKIIKQTIKKIEEQGAKIEEISLPHTEYALACYYIIAPSEASANLARYDGIKYGLSKNKEENLLNVYLKSRGEGFGAEVKRRIILGAYSLSAGYYDAYYLKAQEVRNLIKEDFKKAFSRVDLILTPVSPTTAFKIGEKTKDPLSMYLSDIYTVAISLAGLPAISLPCGRVKGLSVGLQIIGNYFEENKILDIASFIEKLVIQ
ncbi:aspartyl/glutamyl-tRNA amidotransferase subunit A [Patescibacteria group bacterium]|nr:aspartyl/glutamyl-tRNA amidotransferase subunit A [Patescibacteria group bacterium]